MSGQCVMLKFLALFVLIDLRIFTVSDFVRHSFDTTQ
jgi:hypothetical protein